MSTNEFLPILICLSLAAACSKDEKKKAVPKKPAPPVQVAEPAPPAEPSEVVEDAALRDALLGTSKPQPQEEVAAQPPKRPVRRRGYRAAEPEEPVDDAPMELTDYDFQATVGGWPGVKRCIATKSVRGDGPLQGAMQVTFTINATGEVIDSRVVDVSNDDARQLAPCVEKKARRIKFPAFAGTDVTKTAKFVF